MLNPLCQRAPARDESLHDDAAELIFEQRPRDDSSGSMGRVHREDPDVWEDLVVFTVMLPIRECGMVGGLLFEFLPCELSVNGPICSAALGACGDPANATTCASSARMQAQIICGCRAQCQLVASNIFNSVTSTAAKVSSNVEYSEADIDKDIVL